MTTRSSMRETIRISCEQRGHMSGSASHTFLINFLRDEERAPLAYDDARHGFRLTDETYTLPPVSISRREAFSFALARKLLVHYEGTPLHLDMRSVLDKIAESLEGDVTIEPDWLGDHVAIFHIQNQHFRRNIC